jgi:hypothetical protein
MNLDARGPFDVTMTPQGPPDAAPGATLARMSLDKRYHGDLEGTGRGEMLSAVTATAGSAGYVAIERFVGTLHGRPGSFVLQHDGLMDRGAPLLLIRVVPDSGTGELAGIMGTLDIRIDGTAHFYQASFSLPG